VCRLLIPGPTRFPSLSPLPYVGSILAARLGDGQGLLAGEKSVPFGSELFGLARELVGL